MGRMRNVRRNKWKSSNNPPDMVDADMVETTISLQLNVVQYLVTMLEIQPPCGAERNLISKTTAVLIAKNCVFSVIVYKNNKFSTSFSTVY